MTIVKLKEEVEILHIIAKVIAEQHNLTMIAAGVEAKKIIEDLDKSGYAIGAFR